MLLVITIFLLSALPHALTEPMCTDPPPLADIPTLEDCQYLVDWIFAMSDLQQDMPLLWSRDPAPPAIRARRLPYTFRDPLPDRDCEFVVDTLYPPPYETEADVFPTKEVAEVANAIVTACLIERIPTLGAGLVGPREVMGVVLGRKETGVRIGAINGTFLRMNGSNVALKPSPISLVADGPSGGIEIA